MPYLVNIDIFKTIFTWRRKWQPTPVFLPGISHGQSSLGELQSRALQRTGHNLATEQQHTIRQIVIFLLYNIVLVLPYIDMNPPWVYMCSPSWTPLPPPSPSHPSGSSQCTSPTHAVSCIEPRMVIRFTCDNLHVSMPFSQIILPAPSPTESERLFYTSVSLLLSCIQGYCYHLSKFHIYALVYYTGVFLSGLLHSV